MCGLLRLGLIFSRQIIGWATNKQMKAQLVWEGIYMVTSSVFIAIIVMLEAGPVYAIFSAHFKGEAVSLLQWVWIGSSFIFVILLNIFTVKKPMSLGLKAIYRLRGIDGRRISF